MFGQDWWVNQHGSSTSAWWVPSISGPRRFAIPTGPESIPVGESDLLAQYRDSAADIFFLTGVRVSAVVYFFWQCLRLRYLSSFSAPEFEVAQFDLNWVEKMRHCDVCTSVFLFFCCFLFIFGPGLPRTWRCPSTASCG